MTSGAHSPVHVAARMRRLDAIQLRIEGCTFEEIADQLGYAHRTEARKAVIDGLRQRMLDRKEFADALIQLELERYESMERVVHEILAKRHLVINNGEVVTVDGQQVVNDAPALACLDRLLKISEARRRMLGMDAPVKTDVHMGGDLQVRYIYEGVDIEAV